MRTLKIEPGPRKTTSAIPALRPYDFTAVKRKLPSVSPSDRRIADAITG